MKIFSNLQNYQKTNRYHLNNIIKMLWNERTNEERRLIYGNSVDLFTFEPNIKHADLCILTYHWNYYVDNGKEQQASEEVELARNNGKPILVFCGGDSPANLPFNDVILFESAGYRSQTGLLYHSAQPSYIADYLKTYCQEDMHYRQKHDIPVIGFCGQASISIIQTIYRTIRLKWHQRLYQHGKIKWEPAPFETSTFRNRVLQTFENKPGIRTNYLIRRKYRAGETKDKSPHHPKKLEFVNNILESDYTLCMRGGGNFSVRFYETLCLGRIPIFIDTDCLLPFQDEINYEGFLPWIQIENLPKAAEIIRNFHAQLSEQNYLKLQNNCRQLWVKHMTVEGFYRDLVNKMNDHCYSII